MKKSGWITLLTVFVVGSLVGVIALSLGSTFITQNDDTPTATSPPSDTPTAIPTVALTPTPSPTMTPSQTLLPPPTFEPPTSTPMPSLTPSTTPTPQVRVEVDTAGIRGAESPTPSTTPGCTTREDWPLTYEVQANDTLTSIAAAYNTYTTTLAEGNCLDDPDAIYIGQSLHVPGDAHPVQPVYECIPFEVHTPMNGAYTIQGEGMLTFHWRGPNTPRNLIRVIQPNGEIWERLIEGRQNETIDMYEEFSEDTPAGESDEGVYTWYVYPLGMDFLQIDCPEGGPWTFFKAEGPTPTPTMTPSPTVAPVGGP